MTSHEAARIVTFLLAAFPTQVVEKPTLALYRDHLLALPWRAGRTEAAIRAMVASRSEPHLPSIGAVVSAAGVAPEAAHLLVEAMTTGRELVPDAASRTGWAVGEPARPLPNGAAGALPDPDGVPEPKPEAAFTEEERRGNLRRLGGLFREMTSRREAS